MSFKPEFVYILRHDDPKSHSHSEICAESVEKCNYEWSYWEGYSNMTKHQCWEDLNLSKYDHTVNPRAGIQESKAACCTASHINIWKHVADGDHNAVIILEHDAYMYHRCDLDLPENTLVALGYRIRNYKDYNFKKAGEPKSIVPILRHGGSHAYAITKQTAKTLIDNIKQTGPFGCIDNHLFGGKAFKNQIQIAITDPISAVAWLRESTIRNASDAHNFNIISSYRQNIL